STGECTPTGRCCATSRRFSGRSSAGTTTGRSPARCAGSSPTRSAPLGRPDADELGLVGGRREHDELADPALAPQPTGEVRGPTGVVEAAVGGGRDRGAVVQAGADRVVADEREADLEGGVELRECEHGAV